MSLLQCKACALPHFCHIEITGITVINREQQNQDIGVRGAAARQQVRNLEVAGRAYYRLPIDPRGPQLRVASLEVTMWVAIDHSLQEPQ
jgi:hypothetical protein